MARGSKDSKSNTRAIMIAEAIWVVHAAFDKVQALDPLARDHHDELIGLGLETLVNTWKRFRPKMGVKFSTYAFPRVLGAFRDELRQRREDRERLIRLDDCESLEDDGIGPHDRAALQELVILSQLTRAETEVLEAMILRGLSGKATAKVMRISESRVSQIRRAGLRKLKNAIGDGG